MENDPQAQKQQLTPAQAHATNALAIFNGADLKLKGSELPIFVGVHNFLEGLRSGEQAVISADELRYLRAAEAESAELREKLEAMPEAAPQPGEVRETEEGELYYCGDMAEIDTPDYSAPGGKTGKLNGRPNPELNTTEG